MDTIRVLHVVHGMDCGGAENMIMNLYRNIDRTKVQFDFLVHTKKKCFFDGEIHSLGGKIYHVPYFNLINQLEYERVLRAFFKKHPEDKIVHGHLGSCAHIYLRIAKENGCYVIAHSHNTKSTNRSPKTFLYVLFSKKTANTADFFFGCSKQAGIDRYGEKIVNSDKFKVLNNAIDTEKYIFNPAKRKQMREKLCVSENEFVIGTVGRVSPQKNPYKTIEILSCLKDRGEKYRFLWCGKGEMGDEIRGAVHKAGLDDYIDFLGIRNDIPDVLQAYDVFLFPSLWEGLGIVAVEAEASGLPAICSDAVPSEVDLTDLAKHISVSSPADVWADAIIEYKNGYERRNTQQEIINGGYDIHETAKWLENFYLEKNR